MTRAVAHWPSQHGSRSRFHGARADGRRSRQGLLAAAGELLETGREFTLADAADRAGVSVATAYRHFGSAEDLTTAYGSGFFDDLETRLAAADTEERDLLELTSVWVETVLDWGPALTFLRSREGLLRRRARRDPRVMRLAEAVEPALHAAMEKSGGRVSATELSYALGVWNALADPREVLDQHGTLNLSAAEISRRLARMIMCGLESGDQRPPG